MIAAEQAANKSGLYFEHSEAYGHTIIHPVIQEEAVGQIIEQGYPVTDVQNASTCRHTVLQLALLQAGINRFDFTF